MRSMPACPVGTTVSGRWASPGLCVQKSLESPHLTRVRAEAPGPGVWCGSFLRDDCQSRSVELGVCVEYASVLCGAPRRDRDGSGPCAAQHIPRTRGCGLARGTAEALRTT